jgi:hypothetical protein
LALLEMLDVIEEPKEPQRCQTALRGTASPAHGARAGPSSEATSPLDGAAAGRGAS